MGKNMIMKKIGGDSAVVAHFLGLITDRHGLRSTQEWLKDRKKKLRNAHMRSMSVTRSIKTVSLSIPTKYSLILYLELRIQYCLSASDRLFAVWDNYAADAGACRASEHGGPCLHIRGEICEILVAVSRISGLRRSNDTCSCLQKSSAMAYR